MKERDGKEYRVVLFKSVHHAMRAEKLLKEAAVDHKLVPVPKHISSDCGVCVRFREGMEEQVISVLEGNTPFQEIRSL